MAAELHLDGVSSHCKHRRSTELAVTGPLKHLAIANSPNLILQSIAGKEAAETCYQR